MPDIGVPELIIILVVLVLLFGARKLPDLARSIGRSTSEFKRGMREGASDEPAPPQPPAQATAPAQPSAPPPTSVGHEPPENGTRPTPAG